MKAFRICILGLLFTLMVFGIAFAQGDQTDNQNAMVLIQGLKDGDVSPIAALSAMQRAGYDITALDVADEVDQRQQESQVNPFDPITRKPKVGEDCSKYNTWWNGFLTLLGIHDDFHECMCINGATQYCED